MFFGPRKPRLSVWAPHPVQVLDDSIDKGTRDLVDDKVAEWRERGVEVEVRRRTNRAGYKAGALHEVGPRARPPSAPRGPCGTHPP